MGHILVLSGAGRYADNIHDFDATSEAVSQVLTERGHQVEVRRSYPEALDHLAGADLLIVNTGGGDPEEDWDYIPLSDFDSTLAPESRALKLTLADFS